MNWKRLPVALAVVILCSAFVLIAGAGAEQLSFQSTKKQEHVCTQLMKPALYGARRQAQKIDAKDIQGRLLEITKQLASTAAFQEVLDCLRRYDDAE